MTSHEQASNAASPESTFPWSSPVIPDWTRAEPGAVTPSGFPAVFMSSTHAWIAIRLVYLAEVTRLRPADVTATEQRYRDAHHQYVAFLETMRNVVAAAATDLEEAAAIWNRIDQSAANEAITLMFCEREPAPAGRRLLATTAQQHYGLVQTCTVPPECRDRPSRRTDNQAAWDRTSDGKCAGCGAPTIAQRQHDHLRSAMSADHGKRFNLGDTYLQASGARAPLWSSRLLIAAKGVADHIIPWSCSGPTTPDNLVNVCAACNYSRNDSSLDRVGVSNPSR